MAERRCAGGAFLLIVAAGSMLGGCDRQPSSPLTQGTASPPPVAEQVLGARWQAMFTRPAAIAAAANEFRYGVGPYTAAGGRYSMVGPAQHLPDATAPMRVTTTFTASGPSAKQVSRIEFGFDVIRSRAPGSKKERQLMQVPRRLVQGFLGRFELGPSDAIRRGLQDFTSAHDVVHGGDITVRASDANATTRRLQVIITPAR